MAIVLVATPGAIDANSYVDKTYSDAYFATRLGSDTWIEGESSDKTQALIQATRILDNVYDWNGWQASSEQALRWPRDGAINEDQAFGVSSMFDYGDSLESYYPNDIVPKKVKDATCEMAFYVLANSGYTAQVNDLKLVKVGPIRVDFNEGSPGFSIPLPVFEMLRTMGMFRGIVGGSGINQVRVIRT